MENEIEKTYMSRCLQLAAYGKGNVSPNPMVGALVVHEDKIIGEGFHRQYGQAHAEVNAIANVKDKSLLKNSIIYVSLEPCSHYGKTPPCAQLIIDSQIPRVVIAMLDPYPKVSGRGVKMLEEAGIEVRVGLLEKEAKELNREFLSSQLRHRPYVYLKWAQTKDGFIDKDRDDCAEAVPTPISNAFTHMQVHKKRSEIAAIMIGTNTAIKDNPSLTTRLWYGHSPIRVVLDKNGRIPATHTLFNNQVKTLIFTEELRLQPERGVTEWINVGFDENLLINILKELNNRKIDSLLVEGGSVLLQSFIDQQLWDEAYIEVADREFGAGVRAPQIEGVLVEESTFDGSKQQHISNSTTYNFI